MRKDWIKNYLAQRRDDFWMMMALVWSNHPVSPHIDAMATMDTDDYLFGGHHDHQLDIYSHHDVYLTVDGHHCDPYLDSHHHDFDHSDYGHHDNYDFGYDHITFDSDI